MEEIINKLESIISNIFNITIEELRDNRKLRSHTDAMCELQIENKFK